VLLTDADIAQYDNKVFQHLNDNGGMRDLWKKYKDDRYNNPFGKAVSLRPFLTPEC